MVFLFIIDLFLIFRKYTKICFGTYTYIKKEAPKNGASSFLIYFLKV